jgi:hypothetical protein
MRAYGAMCAAAGFTLVAAVFPGVSLKVSRETAPPGGVAQMKVFVTEPKPISTGGASMAFDAYADVVGIALMNPNQDVTGVALVRGTDVSLAFASPSATFGTSIDYPVLAVAGHVPADAPIGAKYPLTIDPTALQLRDPNGVAYPVEVKPGFLVAESGVSIHDISPGSAVVPAGGVVTISGSSFGPKTEIRFKEGKLAQVRYLNPRRIDVVVAQTTTMHGMQVKAKNPDGSQATYFSYQRTKSAPPSTDPVLQYAVPLLPPATVTAATLALPPAAAATTYGIAVQNIETTDAVASIDLVDAGNVTIGQVSVRVPSRHYLVRELVELFGFAPDGAATIRVASATPIQVLGIAANQAAGTASPLLPQ